MSFYTFFSECEKLLPSTDCWPTVGCLSAIGQLLAHSWQWGAVHHKYTLFSIHNITNNIMLLLLIHTV